MTYSKKEDEIRQALGVEKKFEVHVSIPMTGVVYMKTLAVMAINAVEAERKAKELINNGEADANGESPQENGCAYDYDHKDKWDIDINWED